MFAPINVILKTLCLLMALFCAGHAGALAQRGDEAEGFWFAVVAIIFAGLGGFSTV